MSGRYLFYFILLISARLSTEEHKFERMILAVGFPYYKILMSLGSCKDQILFKEQAVWPIAKLNRMFDIRYTTQTQAYFRVSKVEVTLVINHTECHGVSEKGIGYNDFGAVIYIPTGVAVMCYDLTIYTCGMSKIVPKPKTEFPEYWSSEEMTAPPYLSND